MVLSMTGFAEEKISLPALENSLCIELRSLNQKNLEVQVRLPEGLSFLEDNIRKKIQEKIKRGRIICTLNFTKEYAGEVFINKALLKKYAHGIAQIKRILKIKEPLSLETLITLPGIFIWDKERFLRKRKDFLFYFNKGFSRALEKLLKARQREGRFLERHILGCIRKIENKLALIKKRFKQVLSEKVKALKTEEEHLSFLKDKDINEEIKRLEFHIKNFKSQLKKETPLGKELDFISQEMLREANTISAKSFDAKISWWLIKLRSEIEEIRQQLQNIE